MIKLRLRAQPLTTDTGWEDSLEILATVWWTEGFLQRFEKDHGYSLVKYLPLVFAKSNTWDHSLLNYKEEFQYGKYTGANLNNGAANYSVHNIDYRTTLNAGYQDYLAHFTSWTHSQGWGTRMQVAYNLPLDMVCFQEGLHNGWF